MVTGQFILDFLNILGTDLDKVTPPGNSNEGLAPGQFILDLLNILVTDLYKVTPPGSSDEGW
jgi:hypothetical protein